jgi:hypothetical protein
VRLLPWLPVVIVIVGILLVLGSIGLILLEYVRGLTSPYPVTTTAALTPGGSGWTSAIGPTSGVTPPGVNPASVKVEMISLNIATRTISTRLSLTFTDSLVSHLRLLSHGRLVPLKAVPHHVWAQQPVDIQLNSPCPVTIGYAGRCPPVAIIPLGQLDIGGFGGSGAVQASITLPVWGWPNRFPSDFYELTIDPQVWFSGRIVLVGSSFASSTVVPARTVISPDFGLGDHTLTAVEDSPTQQLVVGLVIGRSPLYQVTVYLVALLPLLLGVVVVHASVRQGAMKRASGPVFDLGVIGGLIVAMLAILPLRAVLVPTELSATGLTLVDYILVLDVLFIATFVFFQYARFVTTPRKRDQTGAPKLSAEGREAESK